MKMLHMVAFVLVVAGGLNWGLVGFFDFNLVEALVGGAANVVYMLVGVATVYVTFTHGKTCTVCAGKADK